MNKHVNVIFARVVVICLCALVAHLVTGAGPSRADPDPAGSRSTVVLSVDDCARLRAGQAADGVDYVPGVDVGGRPVAPADLPRGATNRALPAADIELELADRGRRSRLEERRASVLVGRIGFDRDGAILLNGEPLAAADRERLAAACREQGLKPR